MRRPHSRSDCFGVLVFLFLCNTGAAGVSWVIRTKRSGRYSSNDAFLYDFLEKTPFSYRPALPFVDLDKIIVDGDWPNNFLSKDLRVYRLRASCL